jgi:hypothetical protein
MGNFAAPTVLAAADVGGLKVRIISTTGPASYDAGGSELDLSDSSDGFGNKFDAFSVVYSVQLGGIAAASSKYQCVFVPGSSGAAATGKIKIHDSSQAADAEASGDLSAVTFYFLVTGR